MKIIRQNLLQIIGRGPVLVSNVPHARASPEMYTGNIVEEAALLAKAHAIIGRQEKQTSDTSISQLRSDEDEAGVQEFVRDQEISCVLLLTGRSEPGIEVRTIGSDSKHQEIIELVKSRLALEFDLKIAPPKEQEVVADSGKTFQTIWVALGPEERGVRKDAFIAGLADSVGLIKARLGYSDR